MTRSPPRPTHPPYTTHFRPRTQQRGVRQHGRRPRLYAVPAGQLGWRLRRRWLWLIGLQWSQRPSLYAESYSGLGPVLSLSMEYVDDGGAERAEFLRLDPSGN